MYKEKWICVNFIPNFFRVGYLSGNILYSSKKQITKISNDHCWRVFEKHYVYIGLLKVLYSYRENDFICNSEGKREWYDDTESVKKSLRLCIYL